MRSWGFSGEVGEWHRELEVPTGLSAVDVSVWVASTVERAVGTLHRPHGLQVSWLEYDDTGTELAFHELDELPASSWGDVAQQLRSLGPSVAVSAVFLNLDTDVIDLGWVPDAGTLQWSIAPPEGTVSSVYVSYSTAIDVWLTATYDEHGNARPNKAAAANRPRLESAIAALGVSGGTSRPYPSVITNGGFADVSDLPPKR